MQRINTNLNPHNDPALGHLLDEVLQKHGTALLAVLVYGSWLRGKRDTMLDFYVLLEDYRTLDSVWQKFMCRLLPPNVYHIHHKIEDRCEDQSTVNTDLRAKYALLTLDRFRYAMQHDFHSYFWARFSQPCGVLYVRDDDTQVILTDTFKQAASTFMQRVLPTMDDSFSSAELWTRGLSLTYQCELRTESSNRGETIYVFNSVYFDKLTCLLAGQSNGVSTTGSADTYLHQNSAWAKTISRFSWWLRRIQGKFLSVLRLFKAAFTFNEPLEYLLWKIERHSGLYIKPSAKQLRYPLIFAWPLLWKLYRQDAFR